MPYSDPEASVHLSACLVLAEVLVPIPLEPNHRPLCQQALASKAESAYGCFIPGSTKPLTPACSSTPTGLMGQPPMLQHEAKANRTPSAPKMPFLSTPKLNTTHKSASAFPTTVQRSRGNCSWRWAMGSCLSCYPAVHSSELARVKHTGGRGLITLYIREGKVAASACSFSLAGREGSIQGCKQQQWGKPRLFLGC